MDRRNFFRTAGCVTVLVANGQVWRAFAQDIHTEIPDGPEYQHWRNWNEDAQVGSLALVRAAILSANCFNTQPWLFKVTDTQIEVYADTKRNLGAFDPYLREMHFSLGCALENLMLTAAANGYKVSLNYLPDALKPPPADGAPELAARIDVARPAPKRGGELYDAIPHRHTHRTRFDPQRPLPPEFIKQVEATPGDDKQVRVFTFVGPELVGKVADAVADASVELNSDPEVQKGTRPWIRTTREQQRELRDGSYVEAASDSRTTPTAYRDLMKTAPVFGLIAVRDRYDRAQTMRAGRVWQRAHLLATARHIAARPANGLVELIDHQRDKGQPAKSAETLAHFTGDASWQPTFMFYMGYALRPAPASPRRDIDQVRML